MVKVKELGFHKGKTWRKHHQQRGGTGSHGQANLPILPGPIPSVKPRNQPRGFHTPGVWREKKKKKSHTEACSKI